MSEFAVMIWACGFYFLYPHIGYWRAWVWPFYAGKKLAQWSINQIGGDA